MDILSFAVGFALGRRKGGGGGYRDRVFHYILDNYIPVYTAVIDSTYTVKIGLCMMHDGNIIKGYPPAMDGYIGSIASAEYNRQTEERMYLIPPRSQLIAVQVMYKNSVPIYAAYFYTVRELYSTWVGWDIDSFSSAFIYQREADFRLDSVALAGCTYFHLGNGGYGSDSFYTDLSFSYTVSQQNYRVQTSFEPYSAWVEKDGDRSTYNSGYGFSSIPVVPYYGAFTDMTTGEFWDEIQNVYYAASIAAGFPTVPQVIKLPID